jgi:hypothetical protein
MADQATSQDDGVREQAQERVQQVAGQAQEAAGQARSRAADQVDQRSTQAGEKVGQTAGDIRTVAEELRKQGKEQPAKLAEQAAERTERVGGYLRDSDSDRILSDVEDFGRRQPWAMVLGGLALGLAASRLLKASSESRYEQSRGRVNGDLGSGAPAIDREATAPVVATSTERPDAAGAPVTAA